MSIYSKAISDLQEALSDFRNGNGRNADGLARSAEALLAVLGQARGLPLREGENVIDRVLTEAASALYFADRADYAPTLWVIAKDLDPVIAEAADRTLPVPLRELSPAESAEARSYVDDVLARRLHELEPETFGSVENTPVDPPDIGTSLFDAVISNQLSAARAF